MSGLSCLSSEALDGLLVGTAEALDVKSAALEAEIEALKAEAEAAVQG